MMNERIRELIEHATTKESFYPAGCNGHHEDRYYFDKEKFAYLIVNECVLQCVHNEDMDLIEKHFGVEE